MFMDLWHAFRITVSQYDRTVLGDYRQWYTPIPVTGVLEILMRTPFLKLYTLKHILNQKSL